MSSVEPTPRRRGPWVAVGTGVVALGLVAGGATWFVPWWSDGHRAPTHHRVAAGRAHTCALTPAGTVRCWGDNTSGQLGDGTTTPSVTPVEVKGLTDVVSLSGSGNGTCALTASGSVSCWGANDAGQLGDGGTDASPVPVAVAAVGDGVLAVSASPTHACALTRSRAVWCWGDNGSGQLGADGQGSGPREVAGLPARSTEVSVGNGSTCVVFTGRTIRCWGDNGDGQLGVGDTRPRGSWAPAAGLPRVWHVTSGDAHACALSHGGAVLCWGANFAGQLGITRSAPNALTPLAVPGLAEGQSRVSAGYHQTCAVGPAGEVTCWGGVTDADAEAAPTQVQELPATQDVSVGAFHACAVAGADVWCWGQNSSGQLGDGTQRDRTTPERVGL